MKKTVLSVTLCSATLFLAAGRADGPKPPPAAPAPVMDRAQTELLQRYDTNHDGKLDENELALAHEAMLKANFAGTAGGEQRKRFRAALIKRFDRNGDGQLDDEERAAMRKYFLDRFDTNHDGRLDDDERAAMREQLKAEAKAAKFKN